MDRPKLLGLLDGSLEALAQADQAQPYVYAARAVLNVAAGELMYRQDYPEAPELAIEALGHGIGSRSRAGSTKSGKVFAQWRPRLVWPELVVRVGLRPIFRNGPPCRVKWAGDPLLNGMLFAAVQMEG